jgi:hypothetical protein
MNQPAADVKGAQGSIPCSPLAKELALS